MELDDLEVVELAVDVVVRSPELELDPGGELLFVVISSEEVVIISSDELLLEVAGVVVPAD